MRSYRLLALVVPVLTGLVVTSGLDGQVARRPFLFKDARAELAAARARGDADVLMVIASMPGANARVAALIRSFGGTVQFQADDVDYLRARIPLDHVEELVAHADVHSTDLATAGLTRTFGLAEDHDGAGQRAGRRAVQDTGRVWPPTWSDYPLTNRYSPLADLNAATFRQQHPTFDGRGVGIAMIDGNPDPLLPELQTAMTLDGRPTRKIFAYQTAIDAKEEPDGRWVPMDSTVRAPAGTFAADSVTYTAPHPGTFRFGVFDEAVKDSLANTGMDEDYNRDGNPDGSSRRFGVLWDEATNDVWVDTDQDASFTDEHAYTDYAVRPEFGVLGTDDPATPVRESVGFAVQTDAERHLVGLHFGVASHASLVVGAAVASWGQHGRFDGVAPGARLGSFSEGGSAYGQTEAVILAARHPDVDIMYLEQYSTITRDYVLRDGRLVPTVIYSRLIERYGKILVVPTHNYPVLGAPDDFVSAHNAIGIGGHESKENFFTNHGVRVEHDDNLLITGGYGPMGNGALAPDVISPSNYVSTARGFEDGRAFPGLFQLPPGYTIAGGTSTATPTAAGAVAVLVSAARQRGVAFDPARIKHAITSSARWVPHLPAYQQGNGVINVAAAWEILQRLDGKTAIDIATRAPVRTPWSGLLATPGAGVGLYERDGWTAGQRGERTVTFTRTSGPREPMTFALSWMGNDGTFTAPASVTLPLDRPVLVTIGVAPDSSGAHTAHLTLTHPDVPGYAHRMLAAIVAAEPLTRENGFTVRTEARVPRPGMVSFFYRVPEGVDALRFDLERPKRAVTLTVVRPDTRNERGTRAVPNSTAKATYVVNDPMPGMWEVRLTDIDDTRQWDWEQARKDEPVPPTPATLTVTALATGVSGASSVASSGAWTESATQTLTATNAMGAFNGRLAGAPMGSARRETRTIGAGEQQVYELEVPEGSTGLVVRAGSTTDPDADLDVFVFDCTDDECVGAAADGDLIGDESVMVRDPAAGTWKVVVDGSRLPSGRTTYEYLDVVTNPAFGAVSVADVPGDRDTTAVWTAEAHVWATPAAGAGGRIPYPLLVVQGTGSDRDPFVIALREVVAGRETDMQPAGR